MRRMTGSTLKPDVPKGPATITGYTATFVGLVAMLLAFIFPEGDEQTLGVIAAGVVALVSLVVTSLGRQKQAVEQIKQAGLVASLENVVVEDEGADVLPTPDHARLRALLQDEKLENVANEEPTP
jgi:hypothetical protein